MAVPQVASRINWEQVQQHGMRLVGEAKSFVGKPSESDVAARQAH